MVTLASSATLFVVEADPVSWAEPHADLQPWETLSKSCAQLWDWAPKRDWPRWRAAMGFAKVLCCWLSETPLSPPPSPPGTEPGGAHGGWGRGQFSLTWTGPWHWSTFHRNNIEQSGTVLIFPTHGGLSLHSWWNTELRNRKPLRTFCL